jgi:L-threonylcarbamoyladenylate synthase
MTLYRIRKAARILREGGLVAFPTETVYGLGADARNDAALRLVFEVKGRPGNHPLIIHLHSVEELSDWASEVPEAALELGRRFWPGPLTLILRKARGVSKVATGGQDSVGLRVPNHPVALALLRQFGGGIAAPSANKFGKVSPTSAEHVRRDLGAEVDLILDGGSCRVGVESTIVDLTSRRPVILRPGGVSRERLEKELGEKVSVQGSGRLRVSGRLRSHYAPRAEVVLSDARTGRHRAEALRAQGKNVVYLGRREVLARDLYASLRQADDFGADVIVVAVPDERGLGLAVRDRLRKAAARR